MIKKLFTGACYTCANSGMIVEVARIRYIDPDGVYAKVNLRYYTRLCKNLIMEERNVKLVIKNIQHWERVDI